jgi:hypothetical protein
MLIFWLVSMVGISVSSPLHFRASPVRYQGYSIVSVWVQKKQERRIRQMVVAVDVPTVGLERSLPGDRIGSDIRLC